MRFTTPRAVWKAALLATIGAVGIAPLSASAEERHRPFELGVFGGVHIFTKDHGLGRFQDDPTDLSPKHGLAAGLRFGIGFNRYIGLELEGAFTPTHSRDDQVSVNILGYRGHFLLHFVPQGPFRPFLVLGAGWLSGFSSDADILPSDDDVFFHAGLGAKIAFTESFGVRLDGRIMVPFAIASPIVEVGDETHYGGSDFEALLGLYFAFGGVKPPPPPPPPPTDPDGDGLFGTNDRCPNEPEDKDGHDDHDGCPDPDNDGDGIPDLRDKCPNKPEDKNGIDDDDGCPEEDPDGDGIVGSADKCPGEAEDKDGFQDDDGCPDPDNDGDGVLDDKDKCPKELETKNNYQDDDGCPDEVPQAVSKFTGKIEGINFKTDSAEITKNSFKTLDRAAKVLTEFKDVKLEIAGHTDERGTAEYNMDLSRRRAESVKNYLVGKGIDASRLNTVGYGFDKPLAPNKTSAGRAKNRRIEFNLIN